MERAILTMDKTRLIIKEKLLEDLMSAWDTVDEEKKENISAILASVVTPIVVNQPPIDIETLPIVRELREKLARYEQADKDGRMIIPPVSIGQKVYQIIYARDGSHSFCKEMMVVGLHIRDDENGRCAKHGDRMIVICRRNRYTVNVQLKEIGKTVFLSREEAESELKEIMPVLHSYNADSFI